MTTAVFNRATVMSVSRVITSHYIISWVAYKLEQPGITNVTKKTEKVS